MAAEINMVILAWDIHSIRNDESSILSKDFESIIPKGVKELRLSDIKQELIVDSNPNTVKTLTLCDGFNQKLTKGMIPECVKDLHIGDIKQDLMISSIPNTLNNVYIYKSCKKSIESFVPENDSITKRVTPNQE
ncbi:hypothetical protein ACTFIT_001358 [Dictyostelium discoideum]